LQFDNLVMAGVVSALGNPVKFQKGKCRPHKSVPKNLEYGTVATDCWNYEKITFKLNTTCVRNFGLADFVSKSYFDWPWNTNFFELWKGRYRKLRRSDPKKQKLLHWSCCVATFQCHQCAILRCVQILFFKLSLHSILPQSLKFAQE